MTDTTPRQDGPRKHQDALTRAQTGSPYAGYKPTVSRRSEGKCGICSDLRQQILNAEDKWLDDDEAEELAIEDAEDSGK